MIRKQKTLLTRLGVTLFLIAALALPFVSSRTNAAGYLCGETIEINGGMLML